jgi:hypothetical protein
MLKKHLLFRSILAASVTTGLVACGGGSSGGGESGGGGSTPQTGTFVDSPVAGLEYTRSESGNTRFLTDENGQFTYVNGETITFSVGQYTMGSAQGKGTVSPRDLGDANGATNIARVLQTLDDDQDPSNGITISSQVRTKASQAPTPQDISTVPDLNTISTEILDIASNGATQLVSETEAEAHLNETLESIGDSTILSCSDNGAKSLTATDLASMTLGHIKDDETLIFEFSQDGFTEYNSDTTNPGSAFERTGSWALNQSTDSLTLTFQSDGETVNEVYGVCDAGNSILFETSEGTSVTYKLNSAVDGTRAAGTYLLRFPDETGAVITVDEENRLTYIQGEDVVSASTTTIKGRTDINWGVGEPADQLLFLSGQAKRAGIYVDIGEDGLFSRLGTFNSTAPIVSAVPTAEELSGLTSLYRSDANDVVTFSLQADNTYVEYYNDSYNGDVREPAGTRGGTWSVTNGELTFNETDGGSETYRVALSATSLYFAMKSESNGDTSEVNRITSTSIAKPITDASFIGSYTVEIPTEGATETLVISEGNSCDYSGTGCNWEILDGKASITFGAGSDATATIWQMANRANGFIFVITHANDATDIEPGFMFRN